MFGREAVSRLEEGSSFALTNRHHRQWASGRGLEAPGGSRPCTEIRLRRSAECKLCEAGRRAETPKESTSLTNKTIDGREAAVAKLVSLFYELGFDGTSLKRIEEQTGLGRASLYNYFPGGKVEMARSVLVSSDQWSVDFLMREFEDQTSPPANRLCQMVRNLDALHGRPSQLSPANAFCIGEATEHYALHVQGHFHGLVQMMSELMVACGIPAATALRRAWEFRVVWEGGLVCARVLGDLSLFRTLMRHMPIYLLSPADTPGLLPPDAPLPKPA